jgi:hypothetical protein
VGASDHPLKAKVEAIERALLATARAASREEVSVVYYGVFDIHPKHLVYWICVKTDAEKHRLQADTNLMQQLRDFLVLYNYPPEGRDFVTIGFESQETVDRESDRHWWYHWK